MVHIDPRMIVNRFRSAFFRKQDRVPEARDQDQTGNGTDKQKYIHDATSPSRWTL